jgi:S1-C subfamily serine protease
MQDAYAETDAFSYKGLLKRKVALGTASVALVFSILAIAAVLAGLPGAMPATDSTPATSPDATVVVNGTANYTSLHETVEPSVVSIYANGKNGASSQGSGFVYDEQGRIVTNWHVIQDGANIYVRYSNGDWSKATVVGTDAYTDLAVLSVEDAPASAEPLPVSEKLPEPGARVVALGSPDNLRGSMSIGVVSGLNRSMTTPQGFVIPDMIQTDAPLNLGNSGGPLVSMDGTVEGVNRARQGDNLGFAVSGRIVNTIVPSLIDDGKHEHALVGIRGTTMTPTVAEANNMTLRDGILVTEVVEDSPSGSVLQGGNGEMLTYNGFEVYKGGDLIVAIDGHTIGTNEALTSYLMRESGPGETVELTIIRDGEQKTVTVTLGERPPYNG